ncbi:MAG: hypothetical protein WAM42_20890 [Candidatus Nitrosopolaris sp.]|jgi:hypothetical protein
MSGMLGIATYSFVIDIGILAAFAIGFGIFRGYSFGKMKAVYSTNMPKLNSSLFLRTPVVHMTHLKVDDISSGIA